MIRDITIGQYYPCASLIHSLNPTFKIIASFLYIASLFIVNNLLGYIVVATYLGVVIKLSNIPLGYILKGMKSIAFLIFFTIVLNIFLTSGEKVIFQYGFVVISVEGILLALIMGVRLVFLLIGTSLLTFTSSPIELTDGIETILKPFRRIGVPYHEIAMMMTIAIRFIPNLLEETDKIMKAQTARGANFSEGSIMKRAKSLLPLLTPLFISAFRRADDLAMAMESRCYNGGENRTRLKKSTVAFRDYVSLLITFFYAVVVFWFMRVLG